MAARFWKANELVPGVPRAGNRNDTNDRPFPYERANAAPECWSWCSSERRRIVKKARLFAFAAALSMGAALPALAALDSDAVYVSPDHYTSASWSDFDGPVERLNVVSDRTVDCDHITVHY